MMASTYSPTHMHDESGVTIVVIAALVTAIGIAVAALIPDQVSQEAQKIKETQRRMHVIRDAILIHRANNIGSPVPCPSSTLGSALVSTAPPTSAACATSGVIQGVVPTKTLALSDEYALDAWGNKFRYVVDGAYTDSTPTGYPSGTPTLNVTSIQMEGNGFPARYINGKRFNDGGQGQLPIALIISSGPNGRGAYNRTGAVNPAATTYSLEAENNDGDSLFFVDTFYPAEPDGGSDDIVEGIFTYKNCEEPVPCAVTGAAGNVPVGCVNGLGYTAISGKNTVNITEGEITHGATRCAAGGTQTLTCNDGSWVVTGGACS